MPVTAESFADISGTITTGGVAQQLSPARSGGRRFGIRNISQGDLWINEVGGIASAAQPSFLLKTEEYWEPPYRVHAAISIYGGTTGQAFAAREW